jgi:hypothetical protein
MADGNRGSGKPRTYSRWEWTKAYAALVLTAPIFVLCWALATFVKRLPAGATAWLRRRHVRYTSTRPMDVRIPPDESIPAYMHRWWRIPRNAFLNCYWHIVLRSDDDLALHDHPWWNFSIVLDGGYYEHRINEGGINVKEWCPEGMMKFRWHGRKAHRLELDWRQTFDVAHGTADGEELPCRTIFVTGPVMRRWGFHDPIHGWIDAYAWDEHCAAHGIKSMPMLGGSDAALSERNHHKTN